MDDLTLKARLQANDDLQKIMTGTGRITDLVPGVANRRYGKNEVKQMKADRRTANQGIKPANRQQRKDARTQARTERQAANRQALMERTAADPNKTAITDPSKTPQNMTPKQAAQYNLQQEEQTLNQIESRRPQLRPIVPMGGGPAKPSGPAIPANAPNAQQAAKMGLINAPPAAPAPAPAAPAPAPPTSASGGTGTGTAPNPVPLPASSTPASVPLPPPAPAAPAPAAPAPAAPAPAAPAPAAPAAAPPAQQGQQPAQQGQAAPAKNQDPAYLASVAEASKRANTRGGLATNPMFAALTGGLGNLAAAGYNMVQRNRGRKDLERLRAEKSMDRDALYDMLTIRKGIQARNTTEVLRRGLR